MLLCALYGSAFVAYLVVSLQGSMQAFMPINRFIHFSDWVIGHSHLAMIGFASFTAAGALSHIWSKIPGGRYSERAMNWAFWLLTVGPYFDGGRSNRRRPGRGTDVGQSCSLD